MFPLSTRTRTERRLQDPIRSPGAGAQNLRADLTGEVLMRPVGRRNRRKRHRSNRVRVIKDDQGNPPQPMILSPSGSLPAKRVNCFLKQFIVWVVEQEDLEEEEECYMGVSSLFEGLVYIKLSEFQRRVRRVNRYVPL